MGDKILKRNKSCPFNDGNNCGEWCELFIMNQEGTGGGCVIHRMTEALVNLPYTMRDLANP